MEDMCKTMLIQELTENDINLKRYNVDICPICFDNIEKNEHCILQCGHSACINCMMNIFKVYRTKLCKTLKEQNIFAELSCHMCNTTVTLIYASRKNLDIINK